MSVRLRKRIVGRRVALILSLNVRNASERQRAGRRRLIFWGNREYLHIKRVRMEGAERGEVLSGVLEHLRRDNLGREARNDFALVPLRSFFRDIVLPHGGFPVGVSFHTFLFSYVQRSFV